MPIANIIIHPDVPQPPDPASALIDTWCHHARISAEHVTINIVSADAQAGTRYEAMAFVYLPTLWPDTRITDIQRGLACAIADTWRIDPSAVHIVTTMVQSGHVAIGDRTETW